MINIFNVLSNIISSLLSRPQKVNLSQLPSQGLFYKKDFEISIKKAKSVDIERYEQNFIKEDLGIVIQKVKKIVEENSILSTNYKFDDLKSIDIVFLFLEIVRFTKRKPVDIKYFDEVSQSEKKIEFSPKNFNYYKISKDIMKLCNKENVEFEIKGYKFSLPSIGVENSLTKFLVSKSMEKDCNKYNDYIYDFTYFLSGKNYLTFDEIENLITIFNQDLDKDELEKIKEIVETFLPLQKYSLIKNGRVIDINSKIDLKNIWK